MAAVESREHSYQSVPGDFPWRQFCLTLLFSTGVIEPQAPFQPHFGSHCGPDFLFCFILFYFLFLHVILLR